MLRERLYVNKINVSAGISWYQFYLSLDILTEKEFIYLNIVLKIF